MKLTEIKYDLIYMVIDFDATLTEKRRFFELGIYKGCKLRLIKRSILKHNFLVSINGGIVYALNEIIASKICVKLV